MATTGTFLVRALYDFTGQDAVELNFKTDDILTITSTAVGEGWWYALDSNGQVGVIPENHVQIIEQSNPISTEYINLDPSASYDPPTVIGSQNNGEPPPPPEPDIYANITSSADWSVFESNAQDITSSFDSFLPSTTNDNTSTLPPNPYVTVTDLIPPANTYSTINPTDDWYFSTPVANTPAHSFAQFAQERHGEIFTGGFPELLPAQTTGALFDVSNFYSETSTDIPPALFAAPDRMNQLTQSLPMVPVVPRNDLVSSPVVSTAKLIVQEKVIPAVVSKKSEDKSGFFTLRRKTPKSDGENRRKSIDILKESAALSVKNDTDSGSFSDPESVATNPALKQPTGTSDAKAASAKARFFDKHGLDNYILNGCKTKSDEHVEIAYDEGQGGAYWSPNPAMPPFTCKLEEPLKSTKLGGLKAFMEYKLHAQIVGSRVVGRRYKHFDWLHEQLVSKFRFICVPSLPGKQIAGRFEHEFLEERRRQLELWLNRICRHPVLCATFPVQHFVSCELTEKKNKDWKIGKRKIEKDDSREASWLHCVTVKGLNLSETQIATQIETFARQQPALEIHMRNLSQGLSKYVERHTELYERDIQRIGELFSKVHTAVQADMITPGNQQLSNSIAKISASYSAIAELYKTTATDGLRYFNEHLQEYIGILACFPSILSIQRSTAEFIRSVQQRGPTSTANYQGALQRNDVFNHVILAEINLFQKDKVHDLRSYMKNVMIEQIQFYERITGELRGALATLD